ncbi:MAG: hypothetical protein JSW59_04310 [Phycisphaerales bacterium]|nr:MAG: hypothetical protein JSW59_04310 [Phycisphaerales bacterium]
MKTIKIVLVALLGLVLCSAAVPEGADYQTRAETFLAGISAKEVDKSYLYKPVSDWTLVNIAFDTKYGLLARK